MNKPETIYLKNYQPYDYIIDQIDLEFDIQDTATEVTSTLRVRKHPDYIKQTSGLQFNKDDYEILSVIANGMLLLPHEYESNKDFFILKNTPEKFELEIKSRLYPKKNTSLEGLYQSGKLLCTQCEAEGFRKITPFPDRPDVMTTYSCTIIADKSVYPVLLSNGNPVQSGELENNRHFVRWEDPFKKPSYLFALVAGDLAVLEDEFTTMSGKKIDLKIYSEKDNIDQCGHAMHSLKQAMKWDEDRFGLEYDLDLYQIVAINDFNAGAMENKGLNVFNSKYVLAKPETATDDDFMNIQGVIGHEYFHNWTGNRVTLKNWFQLSLKEGLTVFRDQEFSSDLNSRGVKRVSCIRNLRAFQFPEDSGPMTHPVRPESYIEMNNFYTMTVYEKGSELVRMIHQLLGEDNFQKGMKKYFENFDGHAVTVEDFVMAMQDASDKNLEHFILWYTQSGTPQVSVSRVYDAQKRQLNLTFEQVVQPDRNQKTKKPLHIPVKLGILNPDGDEISQYKDSLIELEKHKEIFKFKNVEKGCIPSLFRQFSAPVRIKTDFTEQELAVVMGHDSDDFNRWDAAQTLFYSQIKNFVERFQSGTEMVLDDSLKQAFGNALKGKTVDRAFLSKMLTLPSETEIKDQFEVVDVEAIHSARITLEYQLAAAFESDLIKMIELIGKPDPKNISHKTMAARSMKNLCLSYVGALKTQKTTQIVADHFHKAENMTDEFAAFKILSDIGKETKAEAVARFYNKWEHDKLVLDKWFAVQASSGLSDTLKQVRLLTGHPDFSIKNPNKVRSLIYMLALFNPIHFHSPDGSGYEFITERIIELDSINHQIAARLSTCFNHWKRYDKKRKELMKKALERILSTPALSKNVYEIVSRSLE